MPEKLASLKQLEDGRIRLRTSLFSMIEWWNAELIAKGYERDDEVHSTNIWTYFWGYAYEVHYKKRI